MFYLVIEISWPNAFITFAKFLRYEPIHLFSNQKQYLVLSSNIISSLQLALIDCYFFLSFA